MSNPADVPQKPAPAEEAHEEASQRNRRAAVYRLCSAAGDLLYIGSAYNPEQRCIAHKKAPWWPEVVRRTEDWHRDRGSAYAAEQRAIATEGALHNKMGSPDYEAPVTPATMSHKALLRECARIQSESWRIYRSTKAACIANGRAASALAEAHEARVQHLAESGLFPQYVARINSRPGSPGRTPLRGTP